MGASRFDDVGESGDADDFIALEQEAGAVTTDAQADGVVNVNLAGLGAVAAVVEVGVSQIDVFSVEGDEGAEANVGRLEVKNNHCADQWGE